MLQLFPALLSGDGIVYGAAQRISKGAYLKSQLASVKQLVASSMSIFVHCIATTSNGVNPVKNPDARFPFDPAHVQVCWELFIVY